MGEFLRFIELAIKRWYVTLPVLGALGIIIWKPEGSANFLGGINNGLNFVARNPGDVLSIAAAFAFALAFTASAVADQRRRQAAIAARKAKRLEAARKAAATQQWLAEARAERTEQNLQCIRAQWRRLNNGR